MSRFLDSAHGRISRAPLSFGVSCLGMGILLADMMTNGFNLSSYAVGNIGWVMGFAGFVFFTTNCKADKPDARTQGENSDDDAPE